jgi:hypothetical protein
MRVQSIKESREYCYGRPESLLAQTLAETQKKGDETNLKLPKSIPRKPKRSPQYGRQFYCKWEIPLRTST